jgi:TolB-like protein/class 3 adenylate cyclase
VAAAEGFQMERRLAAILAADVVGYSRLMEADEAGTLDALKARRKQVLEPLLAKHHGRIVKVIGDGVLVEFGSAVNAVQCAVELQHRMDAANGGVSLDRQIRLRLGINLGDVIVEGADLYGDGVNVAARLEAMAEPGGICISGSVYEQVRRKLTTGFEDLGTLSLKNLADPVHVYRLRPAPPSERKWQDPDGGRVPLPAKPSVAVLPFTNMSSDPEHEHFGDGLTDDLITDLSQAPGLFVIARNSCFAYKGKPVDVRTIARDLGVRYVVEGSVRRVAERVRINVQLIDALGGGHLWAERFDHKLDDIFSVQDEVRAKIVEALVGTLTARAPLVRNRPANLEAYDLCVRARILMYESPLAAREAHLLLEQSIALDPNFAEAHRWLAFNRFIAWVHWGEPTDPNRAQAIALAHKAVELDPNDAGARWVLGHILHYERRFAEAEAGFEVALRLDPNHADAWAMGSNLAVFGGRPEDGIAEVHRAFRLNPHPPGWYFWVLGQAQYAAGRYAEAVESLRRDETYRSGSRRMLAAALAQLGRLEEARREAEMFMLSNPHFRVRRWVEVTPARDESVSRHFAEGYLKAGLPE